MKLIDEYISSVIYYNSKKVLQLKESQNRRGGLTEVFISDISKISIPFSEGSFAIPNNAKKIEKDNGHGADDEDSLRKETFKIQKKNKNNNMINNMLNEEMEKLSDDDIKLIKKSSIINISYLKIRSSFIQENR